jgi:thymidylate synthase (FAD)
MTDIPIYLKSDIDVELISHTGDDMSIVNAARVCTSSSSKADPEKDQGLINYLMKHRHGSPFEHASMTFLVRAPIFVWREWHRHRIGWSYNEESGRYKTLAPFFYVPSKNRPMMKVDNWVAGRPKFRRLGPEDAIHDRVHENLVESYQLSYRNYLKNLDLGIDPGLARDCLPVGIYSSCYVTCNPRSLMAFLSLRTHWNSATFVSYPLHEIEMAANHLELAFNNLFPWTHAAFIDNGRVAP